MKQQPVNPNSIGLFRQMYKKMSEEKKPGAVILDVKIIDNPLLADNDTYNNLKNHIKMYNKKIISEGHETIDSYEIQCYNLLYTMLVELNAVTDKQNQVTMLDNLITWLREQEKTLTSRQAQGIIRYKTLRKKAESMHSSPVKYQQGQEEPRLPSEVLAANLFPYKMKWRTSHKQHGIPGERLGEFKRKILNIHPLIDQKQSGTITDRAVRVLYPRPVKPQVQQEAKEEEKVDQEHKEGVEGAEGAPPPDAPEEKQQIMIGEEPQQPEEPEEPEGEQEDKLAPKNKIYIQPITAPPTTRIPNDIEAKGTFAFLEPDSCRAERAMQQRFKRLQQKQMVQVKQDQERVQLIENWSKGRSRMTKELQKRLELLTFQPSYKFTEEQKQPVFNLSDEQQRKFSFTVSVAKNTSKDVDLSLQLPRINRSNLQGYESSVQKSKLKDLKKRFSHVLNLSTDVQERQIPKSICQYSNRFKSFSAVLQEHSLERQREIQMEEVMSIKDKLTKNNRLGVNVTALAHGLCLPNYVVKEDIEFPARDLPSNPFMVEKKKKKKKK